MNKSILHHRNIGKKQIETFKLISMCKILESVGDALSILCQTGVANLSKVGILYF